MRENGPCVIASFAQLASVRGLASPSPASGPRARVGPLPYSVLPRPRRYLSSAVHVMHITSGVGQLMARARYPRHDHSRPLRALRDSYDEIVPRFARGRPPRPLSPPTGTRSSLSCRVVLDAQGVRSLILS